ELLRAGLGLRTGLGLRADLGLRTENAGEQLHERHVLADFGFSGRGKRGIKNKQARAGSVCREGSIAPHVLPLTVVKGLGSCKPPALFWRGNQLYRSATGRLVNYCPSRAGGAVDLPLDSNRLFVRQYKNDSFVSDLAGPSVAENR